MKRHGERDLIEGLRARHRAALLQLEAARATGDAAQIRAWEAAFKRVSALRYNAGDDLNAPLSSTFRILRPVSRLGALVDSVNGGTVTETTDERSGRPARPAGRVAGSVPDPVHAADLAASAGTGDGCDPDDASPDGGSRIAGYRTRGGCGLFALSRRSQPEPMVRAGGCQAAPFAVGRDVRSCRPGSDRAG